MAVQDLHEARHVGALEIMGQADIHVEDSNGVLDAFRLVLHLDWVTDGLDANLVDGNLAGVGGILYVRDAVAVEGAHELFSRLDFVGVRLHGADDAILVEAKLGKELALFAMVDELVGQSQS